MSVRFNWTNSSVLKFAAGRDPIVAIESAARIATLKAMDKGWSGPPFDPVELAEYLGLTLEPRSDIPDARTVPVSAERLKIEFNPLRPRARVRFSVAHEVIHSLFPDCGEKVRNRSDRTRISPDEWQLEVLCNVGAAELLMPMGSFPVLQDSELSIERVLKLRKEYDVSIEALLIRLVKLSESPCAAFCASRHANSQKYRVDYVIPSRGWLGQISYGSTVPVDSVVCEVNAIGYTGTGVELWGNNSPVKVECVGLAPYPGTVVPRVVGLLVPTDEVRVTPLPLTEVFGDALEPRGTGRKIVAHVVPDNSTAWGGGGFAAAMRKRFPHSWKDFREQVQAPGGGLILGRCYRGALAGDVDVFHMVAQRGFGPSTAPRIRYASLEACFKQLREWAEETGASIHLPKIGTGHAGGNWDVIREMLLVAVASERTPTTVYSLPNR